MKIILSDYFPFSEKRTFAVKSISKKTNAMARPIKETLVVSGKDARRFAEKMANLKPESKEEKEAAKKVYLKFKSIASFAL